jgi:hypothetical protein
MRHRTIAAGLLAALALAAPAADAQSTDTLTLAQVQRQYPRMNAVHIRKCDFNGDGLYNRSEMTCVTSIYQQMYVSR